MSVSSTEYTFDVYPSIYTPAGPVDIAEFSVQVQDEAADSLNDIPSTASVISSVSAETENPTLVITSAESVTTALSPIPVTFTFPLAVDDFSVTDLVVGNGTADNFQTVDDIVFTADITPTAAGEVTVDVPAASAWEAGNALNTNIAPAQFSIVYTLEPVVEISSSATNPTNLSPIPMTFTFNEDVTGFDVSDIEVTNGTADNFHTVSATEYTADITPTANGSLTVDVPAGAAQDAVSDQSLAATQFSIEYDNVGLDVALSSTESDPTNSSSFVVDIVFTEPVSDFSLADLSIVNATINDYIITDSTNYAVDISPIAEGYVTVDLDADEAHDTAGNGSTAATQFSITYDVTDPTATLVMGIGETTSNTSPLVISASFSEVVTGFDENDLVVTNGSISNFTGSGDTYEFDVTPTADGTVSIELPSDSGTDAAGNGNTEATLEIEYDATAPSVAISSVVVDPTSEFPIPVSVTFDEIVTGFEESDLEIGNGTVDNFVDVDGSEYTFDIIPTAEGEVTVDIDADVASDAAGNLNAAASQWGVTYFLADLSVVISSTESDPTNVSPFAITITFSDDVTGFELSDVTVANGAASNLAGSGSVYTADITPTADGEVTVDIAADVAETEAGALNTAATQFSIEYDETRPTVVVSSVQSTPTNDSPITITIEFSEDVTGLGTSDFTVTNGTIGTLSGSGSSYTLEITPSTGGFVTVTLGDEECEDAAGNRCEASIPYTIQYDITRPSVTISNSSNGHFTFTFSEGVTGFAIGDISISGGSLSNFAGSGITYTADVAASTSTVTISVPADVAVDGAGNTNTASTVFEYIADTTAPSLLGIIRLDANPTKAASVRFSVTFSEPVNGLENGDLALAQSGVSGAAITSISGNGSIYTVTVSTGTGSGSIELRLSTASNILDLNGNALAAVAVTSEAYNIDRTPVTLSASTLQLSFIQSAAVLSVQFVEDVYNPVGNSDTDDVTNPNNFIILRTGTDGVYNTTTCAAGVSPQDARVTVNSVTYNNSTFTATLNVNNGVPLAPGNYRLVICGTTSVTDLAGNSLNGGNDVNLDVVVWDQTAPQPGPLPVTGFAPASSLPAGRPAAYQPSGATLNISSIGLNTEMVNVPFNNNDWDIAWLGDKVGVLVGMNDLAQPDNTVVTGHNWDYDDTPGPFLNLSDVAVGEKITITTSEGTFIYTVIENKVVDQYDTNSVFGAADLPTITLVTCDGYDAYSQTFTQRRVVRAVIQ